MNVQASLALLIGGLVLLSLPLAAEPAPTSLTIDQAVDLVVRNNLTIQGASLEAALKKRTKDYSFNILFPTVAVSSTVSQLNQTPSPTLVAVTPASAGVYFTPDRQNLSLNLTLQEVFTPVVIGQFQKIDVDYQNALVSRDQTRRLVVASVKKAFYQLIVQKKTIELTQTRLKNSEERFRQSGVSYQLGQQSELTYIQNQVDVEGLKPQLQELKTTYTNNLVAFQEVLGLDPNENLGLDGSLEEGTGTLPELGQLAPMRLDGMAQEGAVQGQEANLKMLDLSLLPRLVLGYSADPNLNGPQNKDLTNWSNWPQTKGALSLTLTESLEGLIPGSSFWLSRAELADRLALARETLEQTRRNGRDDLKNRERAIQTSYEKLENLKRSAAANQRALELTNANYQLGNGRLLDLQAAELNDQLAQIQLLNERLNLKGLFFDLEAQLSPSGAADGVLKGH